MDSQSNDNAAELIAAIDVITKLGEARSLERLSSQMMEWSSKATQHADSGEMAKAAAVANGALLGARDIIDQVVKNLRAAKGPGQ